MLDVIVSKPMSFAGIDVSDYTADIEKAHSEGHIVAPIMYLHGAVESEMGYDIGVCLNGEEYINADDNKYVEGVYDVAIRGYSNKCKAFLWNSSWGTRGLIVDITDTEYLNDAQDKFNKKVSML